MDNNTCNYSNNIILYNNIYKQINILINQRNKNNIKLFLFCKKILNI